MNTRAVADAIAGRFAGVTASITNPQGIVETEGIAVGPTSRLPNAVGRGVNLLVFHPTGPLDIGVSKLRSDTLDFPVRMLRDPLDTPGRSDWLYAWYDAMRDRVEMDMDLGLSYVAWARPISMAAQIEGFEYAKVPVDMVELVVRVRFNEVVTTVAP